MTKSCVILFGLLLFCSGVLRAAEMGGKVKNRVPADDAPVKAGQGTSVGAPVGASVEAKPTPPGVVGEEVLSLASFMASQDKNFEESETSNLLNRKTKLAEINEKAAVAYDPWSLSDTVTVRSGQNYDRADRLQNRGQIKYQSPKGTSAEAYFEIAEPIGGSNYFGRSTDSVGLSLGYEFNKSARAYDITKRSALNQKMLSKLELVGSYYDQKENYMVNSLILYVQHCKLRDKQTLESLVKQTLMLAEVRLASKSIDVQDYIRITDLALSYQREIQTLLDGIYQSERSLFSITPEIMIHLKSIEIKKLDCERILEEAQNLALPPEVKSDEWVSFNASILALQRRIELAALSLRSQLNTIRPSLQWIAGVDARELRVASDRQENLYVGFKFDYNIPEKQAENKIIALEREVQNLSSQKKISEDSLRSKIIQLVDSMRSVHNFSSIAKKAYQNNIKGLKVTQTRQEIGMINANDVFAAYSNLSSSISALRDLWQNYRVSKIRLEMMENNYKRSKVLQAN